MDLRDGGQRCVVLDSDRFRKTPFAYTGDTTLKQAIQHTLRTRLSWNRLWRENATPARLSIALGLGVFLGCTPLFGVHWILALGLAYLFRLNLVATVLGTQISSPLTAALLAFGSVQLGSWLRTGHFLNLKFKELSWRTVPSHFTDFILDWWVGAIMVGILLGLCSFGLTYLILTIRGRMLQP